MSTVTKVVRREFLHLAHTYKPQKPPRAGYNFAGWYLSEKLDGQRCFWDGGVTRGMKTTDVPWASVLDPKKPGKRKKKIRPDSTGLWSRYGNPIQAPEWFLNGLPCMPLDGELFAGRGNFQTAMSAVRKDHPIDDEWKQIQYAVYGSPPLEMVFRDGEIKNTNFHCSINCNDILSWISSNSDSFDQDYRRSLECATFEDELALLGDMIDDQTDFAYLHKQVKLPGVHAEAVEVVEEQLLKVLHLGGEGIILRDGQSTWQPKRMAHMLKYKPYDDDEGTVTGFTSGRETNKGSKLLGMIGALILNYKGTRLELAGLTNEERLFYSPEMSEHAEKHPGTDMPADFKGAHFKVGDTVQFKYRELSDDGIPKEARFFRERAEK